MDLVDPNSSERSRRNAAELLQLFASHRESAALQQVLLDRSHHDRWVRTYLLRAFVRQGLALTDRALARLCAEAVEQAEHDDLVALLLAARSPDQDAIVHAVVRNVDATIVRDVVLAASGQRTAKLTGTTSDLLYRRCLGEGLLDDALAWATLERSASQQRVLDRDPLDLIKLARVTLDWEPADVDAVFAERPEVLSRALAGFALPRSYVSGRVDATVLHDNAARLIDMNVDNLLAGRPIRAWFALRAALDSLREPARHIDALIAEHGAAVLDALGWFRVTCEPAADFDRLPLPIVHTLTSRVATEPSQRDRALLLWLANRIEPRFHHAGLRGLLLLDHGHVDSTLVDRLATSPEPLVRLLALEARMNAGEEHARGALIEAASSEPHVVMRAQALRSLRRAEVSPEIFRTALRGDHVPFDMFYLPAVSEAALGLARGVAMTELDALSDLVDAHRAVENDDAPHAIRAAIGSWTTGTAARIRPVWYDIYMSR